MNRRRFAFGLVLMAFFPKEIIAQPNPRFAAVPPSEDPPRPQEFHWPRPNIAPYKGSAKTAVVLLTSDGLVPPDVIEQLYAKASSGVPDWSEDIPRNYRITRMLFTDGGKHVVATNVVAMTDRWPQKATRLADFYRIRAADGKVYLLIRPHVCGNWSLRIVTPQGVCIEDPVLCEQKKDCEKLRRLQS